MVPPKDKSFEDYFQDDSEQVHVSDDELARMMAEGSPRGREERDSMRAGDLIECIVVSVTDKDLILEIDAKTTGAVELSEFAGEPPPKPGTRMKAQYRRYDKERGLAILTVSEVRKDIFWEEVRPGSIYEGVVTSVNKGGLGLSIKGARAFLPVSQIEFGPVDAADLPKWMGKKLAVEVTSVDRGRQEMVVTRRHLLEAERSAERSKRVARLVVGAEVTGQVVRVNEHGAFIDLGGVDGLLHSSKIHRHVRSTKDAKAPKPGDTLTVRIVTVDAATGRVGLELPERPSDQWAELAKDYQVGDAVTGIVARVVEDEIHVTLGEGVEGIIRNARKRAPKKGEMLKAIVAVVDPARRFIELNWSEA